MNYKCLVLGFLLGVLSFPLTAQKMNVPFESLLGENFWGKVVTEQEFMEAYNTSTEINPSLVYHMLNFYQTINSIDNKNKVRYRKIFNDFTNYYLYKNYKIIEKLSNYVDASPLTEREKSTIKSMLPQIDLSSDEPKRDMTVSVNDTLCFIIVKIYNGNVGDEFINGSDYHSEFIGILQDQIDIVNNLVATKRDDDVLFGRNFLDGLVKTYRMALSIGEVPEFNFPVHEYWKYLINESYQRVDLLVSIEYSALPHERNYEDSYVITDYASENLYGTNTILFSTEYHFSVGFGLRYRFSNTADYFPHIDATFQYIFGHTQEAIIKEPHLVFAETRYEYSRSERIYYLPFAETGGANIISLRISTPAMYMSKDFYLGIGADFIYSQFDYAGGMLRGDTDFKHPIVVDSFREDDPRQKFTKKRFSVSPIISLNYHLSDFEFYTHYSIESNIIVGTRFGVGI